MKVKSFLASKTVWIQIIAVVSALIPVVAEWIATNPVEVLSVFAAINVLVRFVSSGKISVFTDGKVPMVFLCMVTAVGLGAVLPSCSALEGVDFNGRIYYQHETGAKGGITLAPGEKPGVWFRLPVRSSERTAPPVVSKQAGIVPEIAPTK